MRILVVEDDKSMARYVAEGFREKGLTVDVVQDGEDAYSMARTGMYDVIVLDIMLPGRSGFDVIRQLRAEQVESPILCLTARDELEDKVTALELGADDYLPKPFEFAELLARVRALARRTPGMDAPTLTCADLTLDPVNREVTRDGQEIDLSPKEFSLLEYLLRRAGSAVSRTSILDNVWDMNYNSLTNVVDVMINRLRNKVDYPFEKDLIETVRGVGYRIRCDGEDQ